MTNALLTFVARRRRTAAQATPANRASEPLAVPLGSATALTLGGTTSGSENKRKIYAA